MQNLIKDFLKPGFWVVDAYRGSVKPFPGRFPTRWLIGGFTKDGVLKKSYRGKPSIEVMHWVAKWRNDVQTVYAMEFDRLGAIRSCKAGVNSQLIVQQYAGVPIYYYYPWSTAVGEFFYPWRTTIHSKLCAFGKRRFVIYSPYKVSLVKDEDIERWRQYKSWLRKTQNLWK